MLSVFRNLRIRNKLFLAYSCAFFLAFAVAGVIVYSQVRGILQGGVANELSHTTDMIQGLVRTNAEVSIRNYMRAVAEKNYEIAKHLYREVQRGKLTEDEAKNRAREMFLSQSIGKTGRIYCIDSNGIMVVHPKRSFVGVDMSGLLHIRKQIEQKNGFMQYDWKEPLEREVRSRVIAMTYFEPWDWIISVSTYQDEFNQLVNVDDLRKHLYEFGSGESGYPFVLDYDGFLLVHPHLEGKHFSEFDTPALSAIAERIISEKNGYFDYDWRNPGEDEARRKVVYFKDIPEMRWVISSSSYYEDFEGPLDDIGYVFLLTSLAAIVLMIPISMWIGASITRPLNGLKESFSKAADGDFSVRVSDRSGDELGLLAGYFNSFMEKLTEYSNDLRDEIAVRKETEKKLIALDKAKTMFLSSASHELRTPLTSIIGFLKLMEKNFRKRFMPHLATVDGTLKTTQFLDNFAVVRSEADRLGRLVNDLLDLNKIESGRMEWRDELLDVNDVLRQASESISGIVSRRSAVDFRLEEAAESFPPIKADRDRVHQVLINLLSNSFKYTDSGLVVLSARTVDGNVEFSVSDTGRGISEQDVEKVFEIFYQVHDENKRSSKTYGTGLGLAISRQIATHYGGKLMVESAVGKGSCFTFTLPSAT